jgi:predicted phosphodiesterase
MRVAAIYDIHGNLPALEAVLEDVCEARVDRVVVGGDVIPGPMPRESIQYLLNLPLAVVCIAGNGEREVLAARSGEKTSSVLERFREMMRWTAGQLDDEQARAIATWPKTVRVDIPPLGNVLFCHATPRNDTDIFTRTTAEAPLLPIFESANAALVVCGHTHMQFDRMVGGTRVVNAGSVGMPFDEAGAYWLLLGPDVELRHTRYDLARAAARIRATTYPQAVEFAEQNVLHPPSAEATLRSYASLELGSND